MSYEALIFVDPPARFRRVHLVVACEIGLDHVEECDCGERNHGLERNPLTIPRDDPHHVGMRKLQSYHSWLGKLLALGG